MLIVLCFFSLRVNAYIPDTVPTFQSQQLAAGKILLAGEIITGGVFKQTVILLTRHDQTGTIGLIINRPSELSMKDVIPRWEEDDSTRHLFDGGPVDQAMLSVLVKMKHERAGLKKIIPGIYHAYISSFEDARHHGASDAELVRFYSGYAGWRKGQLEAEIKRGGWHVIDVAPEGLLGMDPASMWSDLMGKTH